MDKTAAGAPAAGKTDESPSSAGGGTSNNSSWRYQSRQRGGRGGSSRRSQYPRQNTAAPKPSNQTLFKGRCPELEGFIFDVGPHQASIYAKTKVEIVEYAGRTYSSAARVAIGKLIGQEARFINRHVSAGNTVAENEITKIHARSALIKLIKYKENMEKLYSVIYGQCTDAMRQQLDTHANFESASDDNDSIALMMMIKQICFKYEAEKYDTLASTRALIALYTTVQPDSMSDILWYEAFDNTVTAAKACGATFMLPSACNQAAKELYPAIAYTDLTELQLGRVTDPAEQITLATLYLERANKSRYSTLV